MTNRYQKEIEEILKKSGESPSEQEPSGPGEPLPERGSGRGRSTRRALSVGRFMSFSYKRLLLAGVGALIVSIFVGGLPLLLIGAGLLAAGYVMYYRAPRAGGGRGGNSAGEGGRPPKMWRGRTIDPGDDPHFTEDRWGQRR